MMPNDRNNDRNSSHTESRSERESLKEREYRGPKGEIHHHTRTYMEQHGGSDRKQGNKDRNTNSGDNKPR